MVLQEIISAPESARTAELIEEESLSSTEKVSPPSLVRLYHPPVPYPQRVARAKLFKLKPRFTKFLDVLRRIYVDTPFLDALKKASAYLQFLREFLSKKGEPEGV